MANSSRTKIFLTHSHKDKAFSLRLFGDLQSHGLDGFFDIRSLKGGDRIAEEIDRGLRECDVYIPILSFASLKSRWCLEELYSAVTLSNLANRDGRPKIIPVLIEDCSGELPAFIISRLQFNFVGRYEEAFKELIETGLGLGQSSSISSTTYTNPLDFLKIKTPLTAPTNFSPKTQAWLDSWQASKPKATLYPKTSQTTPLDTSKFDFLKDLSKPAAPANPVSTVPVLTAEHNVIRNTEIGMVLNVEFTITGFKGHKGRAVAYFYKREGQALVDTDGLYRTEGKDVSAGTDFCPGHESAYYNKLEIFMPYSQLHVPAGKNQLKAQTTIWDMEGNKSLTQSEWIYFHYTRPDVVIDKVWADYDVTQKDLKGIKIHVRLEIVGHKDKKCSATAYFQYEDGTPLKNAATVYLLQHVSCTESFTPRFDDTVYQDLTMFMPYSQLNAKKGKSALKFYVSLWSEYTKLCDSESVSFWYQN